MIWLPAIAGACVPGNLDLFVEIKEKNKIKKTSAT